MERSLAIRLMPLTIFCIAAVAACSPESDTGPAIPTAQAQPDTGLPTVVATATDDLPKPTVAVTVILPADSPKATSTLPPIADTDIEEVEPLYRVVYVEEDDVLNVRSAAGVENDLVGSLEPQTAGIRLTGSTETIDNSLWVSIVHEDIAGWVNSRFLSEDIDTDDFCDDPGPQELVEELVEIVGLQDAQMLADLTDPERGLRIRRHWWNPEVVVTGSDLNQLFDLEDSFDWGRADGSGDPIEGTVDEIILPLLEMNLVESQETGCNEILAGGTAGFVRLPYAYEGINYYSVYRPAGPEDIEFDWGSWAIGIERFQNTYFVSFLVHYEWEI